MRLIKDSRSEVDGRHQVEVCPGQFMFVSADEASERGYRWLEIAAAITEADHPETPCVWDVPA